MILSALMAMGLFVGSLLLLFGTFYVVGRIGVWAENKMNK